MVYFTNSYRTFFRELQANNNIGWFHRHQARYRTHVKEPFVRFTHALIQQIHTHDPEVLVTPSECISRINRDIRFAKDKTPYNLFFVAFVSTEGKRDKSTPGIFVRISADEIGMMIGCFAPSSSQLRHIREHISADIATFRTLIDNPLFTKHFGALQGAAHIRIPPQFAHAHAQEPRIANKQFYFVTRLSGDIITSEHLLPTIMDYWHIARPVNQYFQHARLPLF